MTQVLAKTPNDLQISLNTMAEYCEDWILSLDVTRYKSCNHQSVHQVGESPLELQLQVYSPGGSTGTTTIGLQSGNWCPLSNIIKYHV